MGLNEKHSASADPAAVSPAVASGTGPLSGTPSAENDFRETNWLQPDSSHEEATKKHRVWNLEDFQDQDALPTWVETDSENTTETDSTPNGKGEVAETHKDEAIEDQIFEAEPDSEDIDILSILDLQLDSNEVVPDEPRQLSQDQLTPTDWISELVPQDDELPTMADMLPQPTPVDPSPEADSNENPSNVMDMLFGDSDTTDPEEASSDARSGMKTDFASLEVSESTTDPVDFAQDGAVSNDFEELTMDSWLTDIMSEMDDEPESPSSSEEVDFIIEEESDGVEEIPTWLDMNDQVDLLMPSPESEPSINQTERPEASEETAKIEQPAMQEPSEVGLEPIAAEIEEENDLFIVKGDNNEDGTIEDMSQETHQDSWDYELEEDSLNWLTDDVENEDIEEIASEVDNKLIAENPLQTRDLSNVDLPLDLAVEDDEADAGGAVQANLPNWIKEMAPDASNESVIVPDENNFQMNDEALSEIIAAMESELSLEKESDASQDDGLDSHTPVFEAEDNSQILETVVGKHTEPLPQFDMSAPDIDTSAYIQSDQDSAGMAESPATKAADEELSLEPNEDELLKDAISAIESEIDEIRDLSSISDFSPTDDSDLPEWLPEESNLASTVTTDLPDWLRKPQTEEPLDPTKLGFTEANIEEVASIPADELPPGPADVLDEIISQHASDEPSDLDTIFADMPLDEASFEDSGAADDLAQFDWSDIEGEAELETTLEEGATDQFVNDEPEAEDLANLHTLADEPTIASELESDENDQPELSGFSEESPTLPSLPIEENVANSEFDWLDGELANSDGGDLSSLTDFFEESAAEPSLSADETEVVSEFDWLDGESADGFIDSESDETDPSEYPSLTDLLNEPAESPLSADAAEANKEFDWLGGASEGDLLTTEEIEPEFEDAIDSLFQADHSEPEDDLTDTDLSDLPEIDLLEEPEIPVPDLDLVDQIANEASLEQTETEVEDSVAEPDMSAWDEMEEAFNPLVEFEDETDIFAGIRDTPRVEETISAQSLAEFDSQPNWKVAEEDNLESILSAEDSPIATSATTATDGDDFLSTFTEADEEAELPSWASDLASGADTEDKNGEISGRSPLYGLDNIVDVAPVIASPVQDLTNLHAPQMMEPVAHRKRAHLAAQAAGTVPMSDPTQPVVVPKARQKYQPRFNPNQFDGRPAQQKKKRSRQIGFIVVIAVLALMVAIAFAIPYIISFFSG